MNSPDGELGFTGIAIGDMDGDGHLEGIGLTNKGCSMRGWGTRAVAKNVAINRGKRREIRGTEVQIQTFSRKVQVVA